MRTRGIINADLAARLAALRHTDVFAVSDSGLPVPATVPTVDLAVVYGLPGFFDVLEAILDEVVVATTCVATEARAANPDAYARLAALPALEIIPHEQFKQRIATARFVVRTGEATPYANVLLAAGVPWLREEDGR